MGARGRGGGEGVRTRDHLANVRTTLAWVRAGLIGIAVGYALDKLALLAFLLGDRSRFVVVGRTYGVLVVLGGTLLMPLGLLRLLRARARIESDRFEPRLGADLMLIATLALGGLLLSALLVLLR